jgi:hypothetical protein
LGSGQGSSAEAGSGRLGQALARMLAQAQAAEKMAERMATKVATEVATMVLLTPKAVRPKGTTADEAVRTAERKRKTAAVMTARMTAMAI